MDWVNYSTVESKVIVLSRIEKYSNSKYTFSKEYNEYGDGFIHVNKNK